MFVCLCKGVSDKKIRALVGQGATLKDIMRECGAGIDCGSCVIQLKEIVAESEDANPPGIANQTTKASRR